jgi:hypothetical protein
MRWINSRLALCGFGEAYYLGKENRRLGDIPAMAVSLNAGDPAIQRRSREKVTSSFSNPNCWMEDTKVARSLSGSVRPFQEKCTDDDRACNVLRHAPIAEIVKVQVVI